MAEISKFFNAVLVDGKYDREYFASDFAEYFGDVLSAGLLLDENKEYGLQVTAGTGLQTKVDLGKALIKGYSYKNTTIKELEHSLPEATNDRIDRIVLRFDVRNQSRHIRTFVKEGAPSSVPVVPPLQRDEYVYELGLAQVIVRANTASISVNDITDERALENVCGVVQSLVTVPTSVFQQQFDAWFTGRKGHYESVMSDWQQGEQVKFEAWFESIKGALEGDVAANLASRLSVVESGLTTHQADGKAHGIGDKTLLKTTDKTSLVGAINEAFTSASNGKSAVSAAITGVDPEVVIPPEPTFPQLATAIGQISTGYSGKYIGIVSSKYQDNYGVFRVISMGDFVYSANDEGVNSRIDKIDVATMSLVVQSGTLNSQTRSMRHDGTYLYAGTSNGRIIKFNPSTMAIVAEAISFGSLISGMELLNGHLFVTGVGGKVAKVKTSDMSTVSTSVSFNTSSSQIVTDGEFLYVGANRVVKINPDTLSLISEGTITGGSHTSIEYSKGFIFSGTTNGELFKINPSNMTNVAKLNLPSGTVNDLTSSKSSILTATSGVASPIYAINKDTMGITYASMIYGSLNTVYADEEFVYAGGSTAANKSLWKAINLGG